MHAFSHAMRQYSIQQNGALFRFRQTTSNGILSGHAINIVVRRVRRLLL